MGKFKAIKHFKFFVAALEKKVNYFLDYEISYFEWNFIC